MPGEASEAGCCTSESRRDAVGEFCCGMNARASAGGIDA